ncbi:MAG: hypothetical protein CSA76_03180 [Spirochaetales bacterium]|nr:MAG: hypothetical protein CSA76_03180 [Spirochaetales bacterium]
MPKKTDSTTYKVKTILGGETVFSGTLKFDESLKINGRFEGTIESGGFLVVESGAEIIADVRVGVLVVGGKIRGDVYASQRLELLSGGHIEGNVHSPNLVMAEGAGILGRCEMLADVSGIDIFAMPLDRLKKTVARVE